MSEALTKFSTARLKAAAKWPYAAPAILATVPVEKEGVDRIAADKHWRLYFDPNFVITADTDTVVGSILFEVSHLIRSHAKRFGRTLGFDPAAMLPLPENVEHQRKVWNDAADLEIVDDFDEEHLKLPSDVKRAKDMNVPTGLLAESYFERLYKDEPPGGGGQDQQKQQGNGQGPPPPPKGGSAADGVPRPWDEPFNQDKKQKGDGKGENEPQPQGGDGQGDPNDQDQDGEGDGQNDNDQDSLPGLSEGEADNLTKQVAQRIAEHCKNRGTAPGGWKRWADNIVAPKLNYRKIIERKVQNALQVIRGNLDYSYRRPSRRSIDNGIISPSMISRQIACTVVIDASGSMSQKQLGEAVQIVGKLLQALPKRDAIKVVVADTKVHVVEKVFKKEQIELKGGGGTDMAYAITFAAEQKPRPNLIVVATDGETGWPDKPIPHVNVLAIILTDGTPSAPKWIEQVVVPPNALLHK